MIPRFGYALRRQDDPVIDDPGVDAIELAEDGANSPLRLARRLGDHEFDYVSLRSGALSVASPDAPPRHVLDALRALADENGARAIGDDLGFTRDGMRGVEIGRAAPCPRTPAVLDAVCRNIDSLVRSFAPRQFFIANLASPFEFAGSLSEAQFVSTVLSRTGCGLVLDLAAVYVNAANFGGDPGEFIAGTLACAHRAQLRLTGVFRDDAARFFFRCPRQPISSAVWDLYRQSLVAGQERIEAVFVERHYDRVHQIKLLGEIDRARRLAQAAAPVHT